MQNDGYSGSSIWIHWLTALAVVALFVTHEGSRDSAAWAFHVGGGAIIGLFLLWRVFRRLARGSTTKPQQAPVLNIIATSVIWCLLLLIVVITVTGYLLPWSLGQPLDVYGLMIPSPLPVSRGVHEFSEQLHDAAGHIIILLVILHSLGTLKHAIFDKDGVATRIFKAKSGGK